MMSRFVILATATSGPDADSQVLGIERGKPTFFVEPPSPRLTNGLAESRFSSAELSNAGKRLSQTWAD